MRHWWHAISPNSLFFLANKFEYLHRWGVCATKRTNLCKNDVFPFTFSILGVLARKNQTKNQKNKNENAFYSNRPGASYRHVWSSAVGGRDEKKRKTEKGEKYLNLVFAHTNDMPLGEGR